MRQSYLINTFMNVDPIHNIHMLSTVSNIHNGHHHTVGLCQRLMCCNGELNARQKHQQGSRQQKVFAGAGTWAAIVISYALN